MPKKITRSTVNEQQYSAPEFPTSGFPLSYRRYMSGMLGRIHVNGFQFTMPGDKIRGKSRGQFTFKRIVTPIVSPVNAMQYNIYLPFRPLDRSFKKGITPTKLNAMSANWTMPMCNTRYLFNQLMLALYNLPYNTDVDTLPPTHPLVVISAMLDSGTPNDPIAATQALADTLLYDASNGIVSLVVQNLTTNGTILANMADNLYCRDALVDIAELITAKLGSIDNPLSFTTTETVFLSTLFDCFVTPWLGRYSYYGEFKYEYFRPFDIYRITHGLIKTIDGSWSSLLAAISDTPQNEYPLRAMYAIWYELFRNVDLEPVSTTLPDWQEWSTTSIFDMSNGGNLCYLLLRIRPWEKDMFISSQIDDLSRHVYAPIYSGAESATAYHVDGINNNDAQSDADPAAGSEGLRKPSIYRLGWRDQLSDQDMQIECPVPTNINDVLSALDSQFIDVYGLDLNTLRQSQMLERYLKRNYLFGDEYQDRMLAHYNSRVSDMRINKPEVLSQSMDGYDMGQEVSNVSTDETKVGDRTATATVNVSGNEYNTFCEEFGIIISLVCFMPRAMYDGTTPQLYMSKQVHLPLPEFASNNEEFGRKTEIAGSGLAPITPDFGDDNRYIFGRYPAYHAWRSRVDEVGGEFLDELQDSTFRRFFGMFSDDTTPKLNYFFIHCRPNLNMFADNIMYDTQLYGDIVNECFVERVLPTPVEQI